VRKQQTNLGSPIEQFTRMMFTRIITALSRSLREEDFSLAQIAALHVLDQQGAMRVTALADTLALSPSAGSRLVDGLVQRGLVGRAEDPQDRRAKTLVLTAEGHAFVDRASEDRVQVILQTAESLPSKISAAMLAAVNEFRRR
jgi:DNA-binding MarR family transcriptional regulator